METVEKKPASNEVEKKEMVLAPKGNSLPQVNYDPSQLAKKLKSKVAGNAIAGEFLKMTNGEEDQFFIVGWTMTDPMEGSAQEARGEKVKAILLMDENEDILMAANSVIVSALEDVADLVQSGQVNPEEAGVHITCTGETKGKSGYTYHTFKIKNLKDAEVTKK